MKIDITNMTLLQILGTIKEKFPEYTDSLHVNVKVSTDWDVNKCVAKQFIILKID